MSSAKRKRRKRRAAPIALRLLAPLKSRAAMVSSGFLLIGAGIVANALYLQPGRHPAPLFAPRGSAQEATEQARPQPDLLVQAVQAELRNAGLYDGPVDGIAGPRTQAAILAFEYRTGRDTIGRATPDILAAIQAEADAARGGTTEPRQPSAAIAEPVADEPAPADPQVAAVQAALSRAAYGPLNVDGVFGPQTSEAIKRFQRDHGLAETGRIDDTLIVEMTAAGAFEG